MRNGQGKFAVVDGMDGSGKGTQLALLRGPLHDLDIHYTREPGGNGSPTAEFIRKVILEPHEFNIDPKAVCDFFLFWASRGQHVEEVVLPNLERGVHVLSDRYDSSTVAFQIYGEQRREGMEALFYAVRRAMPAYYRPHGYIILDLPAEVAYERRKADLVQSKTRFDLKPVEYHERVRQGFKDFAQWLRKSEPHTKVYLIDATHSREEVHRDVLAAVCDIFSTR